MRISDWSSDVCSSDLPYRFEGGNGGWWKAPVEIVDEHDQSDTEFFQGFLKGVSQCLDFLGGRLVGFREIGRASCRERVCQYVYISLVAGSLKTKNTDIKCSQSRTAATYRKQST